MFNHSVRGLSKYGIRIRTRLQLESLECRQLLHGVGIDGDEVPLGGSFAPILNEAVAGSNDLSLCRDPVGDFNELVTSDSSSDWAASTTLAAATFALSGIPILNSLSGAAVSLYLDFDGNFDATWGSYSNITTPAFDQDGDLTTFSTGELTAIENIWRQVSEDYSPFNINVTTVIPPNFNNGSALRVAIGGDGAWTGGTYGGVSYVNSFTSSIPNTSFVFSSNLAGGYAKYTAEAVSHEAGHAFGLQHQSQYDANGNLIAAYYAGPGDGTAPIMGNSYSASLSRWWYGTSTTATTFQDDLAIISRTANGFGYRADDHGNSASSATPLVVSGNQLSGSGIVGTTSDVDYFSFGTGAGQINLTVSVPTGINNLATRIELRDANGLLITSAGPNSSFGASLTATVVAGSYRLVIASSGGYGNVGQYTVSGSFVPSTEIIKAPTSFFAYPTGSNVNLRWIDNATNETHYVVARGPDGVTWTTIANLPSNSTSYLDTGASAGGIFYYQVFAANEIQTSNSSGPYTVIVAPPAPTGLTATGISSSQINLAWNDVTSEAGYKVFRSTDGGNTWIQLVMLDGNVTSYQDVGLTESTTYTYRVVAYNVGGYSANSNLASGTTLAPSSLPLAPSSLAAIATTSQQVNLTWQDNSANEDGFRIERSLNGGNSWTLVGQVGADTDSFHDLTVNARKTYTYRVYAYNASGNSPYSNLASVTTPQSATVPNVAAAATPSGFDVDWNYQIAILASKFSETRRAAADSALAQLSWPES